MRGGRSVGLVDEDCGSMSVECYPITGLPHVSQIYRDYLTMGDKPVDAAGRRWYGGEAFGGQWMGAARAGVGGRRLAEEVTGQKVSLGTECEWVSEQASELLGYAAVTEWLGECYLPQGDERPTLGKAFARLMARIFAEQGLIVIDASSREFHALGAGTLRYAIEHADELQKELIARSEELVREGYHAQVMGAEGASLLFLVGEEAGGRGALRRPAGGQWKGG